MLRIQPSVVTLLQEITKDSSPKETALVTGRIFQFDNLVEIIHAIYSDGGATDTFSEITKLLLEEIDTGGRDDYFFTAYVEARPVLDRGVDYAEYDVDYKVVEIKTMEDLQTILK